MSALAVFRSKEKPVRISMTLVARILVKMGVCVRMPAWWKRFRFILVIVPTHSPVHSVEKLEKRGGSEKLGFRGITV